MSVGCVKLTAVVFASPLQSSWWMLTVAPPLALTSVWKRCSFASASAVSGAAAYLA